MIKKKTKRKPAKSTSLKKAVASKISKEKKNVTPKKAAKKGLSSKEKKGKTELLIEAIVKGIQEIKGKNISILNLKKISNRVFDYFIVCQAESNTQVNAIANSVEEIVKKQTGEKPFHKEGMKNAEWILIDYVTVVVHVFQTQTRNFYNLESLWADAEVTEMEFE